MERMLHAPQTEGFLASLLYFFGVLTYSGRDPLGNLQLSIPNLVVRKLYIERIQEALLPGYDLDRERRAVSERFYAAGELEPLCDFIEQRYLPVFDNRDLRWSNELVVKTAFLITLFNDIAYIMDSETAIARGYCDLSLIVRPDRRQYALLDHVIEFKHLKLGDLPGIDSDALASMPREELRAETRGGQPVGRGANPACRLSQDPGRYLRGQTQAAHPCPGLHRVGAVRVVSCVNALEE